MRPLDQFDAPDIESTPQFWCAGPDCDNEVLASGELCRECEKLQPCVLCDGAGHFPAFMSAAPQNQFEEACHCAAGVAWSAEQDTRRWENPS